MVRAWVITVEMGYGHQRAAYPFNRIAEERIITANNDRIISVKEQFKWRLAKALYESISRMRSIPIIGKHLFNLYDIMQHIPQFHPMRDLSRPSFQVYYIRKQVKNGLCKSLFEYIKVKELPVLTTFFITAIAAEYYGMKKVYCICTDTDINRAWVPVDSKRTRIIYCAPCKEVEQRLLEYGVQPSNIILTGFPLPEENIGRGQRILKHDLARRLAMLDPKKIFLNRTKRMVESYLGQKVKKPNRPLTLLFSIGGAGAQSETLFKVMESLKQRILNSQIRLIVSVGTNVELFARVSQEAKRLGLSLQKGFLIIHSLHLKDYFSDFNKSLRKADILWTKPSELSFYTGLGVPIIAAPPIGHHEERNLHWLETMGLAFPQEDPLYTDEWLFSWIEDGRLAEAAFEGPIKVLQNGTAEIIRHIAEDASRSGKRRSSRKSS